MNNGNVTAAYYIPRDLKVRIEQEAKLLERSSSWLVANVMKGYFEKFDGFVDQAKQMTAEQIGMAQG